jgi:hypothetical protein
MLQYLKYLAPAINADSSNFTNYLHLQAKGTRLVMTAGNGVILKRIITTNAYSLEDGSFVIERENVVKALAIARPKSTVWIDNNGLRVDGITFPIEKTSFDSEKRIPDTVEFLLAFTNYGQPANILRMGISTKLISQLAKGAPSDIAKFTFSKGETPVDPDGYSKPIRVNFYGGTYPDDCFFGIIMPIRVSW